MAKKAKELNTRIIYAAVSVAILIIEILIALYVRDSFIRPYGGDILVTALICCVVRVIMPHGVKLLPLWVFIFAFAVELSQLINIVALLNLEHITFFKVLIGTTFSFADLLCYAVGCILFAAFEALIKKSAQRADF